MNKLIFLSLLFLSIISHAKDFNGYESVTHISDEDSFYFAPAKLTIYLLRLETNGTTKLGFSFNYYPELDQKHKKVYIKYEKPTKPGSAVSQIHVELQQRYGNDMEVGMIKEIIFPDEIMKIKGVLERCKVRRGSGPLNSSAYEQLCVDGIALGTTQLDRFKQGDLVEIYYTVARNNNPCSALSAIRHPIQCNREVADKILSIKLK